MSLLQILKDYAPIVSPILSPIIAAWTAIFLFQRKGQERVHCSLEWRFVAHSDGQYEEPFLVVHNRSDRSVAIKDLRFFTGALWRKRSDCTALGFEDPEDISPISSNRESFGISVSTNIKRDGWPIKHRGSRIC